MNFQSRITKTSTLPGFEGVAFTLNKMTEGRRTKLRLATADIYNSIQELLEQARALAETDNPEAARLLAKVDIVSADRLQPALMRWGLHSITGLDIDGLPATAESIIESGPSDLYAEIIQAIQDAAGLTEKQQGESELPTIFGAQEDGQKTASSVPVADGTVAI